MMFLKFGYIFSIYGFINIIGALADEEHFFVQKMSFEDRVKILEAMGETCDIKPTTEILREILHFKPNVGRDTKCFLRCLVEWFDLHVDNAHHVDVERIMEFAVALFPDTADHIRTFLHMCNDEIKDINDKCDAAHEHEMCMHRKLIENGIDIPDFEG